MNLILMEYIKNVLNEIKPTYVITPKNIASNKDNEWIVVSTVVETTETPSCSNVKSVVFEVNIIDRENYTDDTRIEVTQDVFNTLKNIKQVSYKGIRIYEITDLVTNTLEVNMYNKTFVSIYGVIYYA